MSNKTITLEDDVHIKLSEIQLNLRKIGIEERMHNICDVAIRDGIDNAFELIKADKTFIKNYEESVEKVSQEITNTNVRKFK